MKYAVIKSGGKQYLITEGQTIRTEKINSGKNKPVEFKEVLLLVDDGRVSIGQPNLDVKVKAKVVDQMKDQKLVVSKYKAKTGYHKKKGHRQLLTKVLIEKIGA